MNQNTQRIAQEDRFAGYREDFERLRMQNASLPVHQIRIRAFNQFVELGFPVTREIDFPEREDWLFTNVAPIARTSFRLADSAAHIGADVVTPYTFGADWPLLVFFNGAFQPALSHLNGLTSGVRVLRLSEALAQDPGRILPFVGRQADISKSGFTAFNTSFLNDGAVVEVPAGKISETPIHVLYLSDGDETPVVSHPRTLIVLGDGASASVIESYAGGPPGNCFTNAVTEIFVGKDTSLDHYRINRENRQAFHVSTTEIYQEQDSHVSTFSMCMGGALTRNDTNVRLDGARATIRMNGLYLVTGRQHVDNHTWIEHRKPDCDSYEVYKGILEGGARSVFNGKVYVHREAQNTDAKQLNKNLLLSPDASANTKPQLEIHADQVKCTHGATVGQLDEEQIFYLRTRGLSRDAACHLLTYGFAGDLIRRIRLETLRTQLDGLFETTIRQLAMAQSTV